MSAILLASLALVGGEAGADQVTGQAQVQFQKIEQHAQVVGPDGTRRDTTIRREIWVQNYELTHAARIGSRLDVTSQLRLTDLAHVGRADASRTPYGALRLVHPVFGLTGSYRPSSITTAAASAGFLEGPLAGAPQAQLTTRSQEALVTGYLAPARLPRLDVSWIRRHRDPNELASEETGLSRSLRLGYEAGPLNLHGGYQDMGRDPGDARPRQTILRSLNGGAGVSLTPVPALSLAMNYDYSATRRGAAVPSAERARTHAATLNGSLRQSERASWTLAYAYRRSEFLGRVRSDLDDHDGSMLFHVTPGRGTLLSAAGGARTVRTASDAALQRYIALVASADGRVRPGWTGTASASHATQWEPERGTYSVENLRAGSRFRLARGLDLDLDAQVIANGDTAARDARVTTQRSLGVQATPLRTLSVRYSVRSYRVGRGVFRASGDARSSTLDLRWRPHAALELNGSRARGGSLSRTDPQLTTRQAGVSWRPGAGLQLTGSWTRSDQASTAGSTTQLVGREFFGGRLLASLGRRTTLSAGVQEANANGQRGSRQYDAAVTRSFGR